MEKQVSLQNGNIHYRSKGLGSAVVLLHGFMENHTIWDDFSDVLSRNYLVIGIDLPGHGKSDLFGEIHSMDFMAEAVGAVLDQEKVKRCIMVGHSMGGYVTLAFARKYAERLNGIVLFHSQAAADDEQGKINRNRTIDIVKGDHGSFIHAFVPTLFCEDTVKEFSREIEMLTAQSVKMPVQGITAALAGMRDRQDSRELLAKLNVPVLFIIGKKDEKIPLEKIMDQLPLPANSEALIIDNIGHMGFLESRDLTLKALEHFVERNSVEED
ncbi:MAG: alpha/beta hydrolase [bacterium]